LSYSRLIMNSMQWQRQAWVRLTTSPTPLHNILVKNQEVNCAKFSHFDGFCSQNL